MKIDSTQPRLLSRREAIQRVSALFGGVSLVGGNALLVGCASVPARNPGRGYVPSKEADIALLDEIADTILPQTTTPGAKSAHVGEFMALMVADAYAPADRRVFRDGMESLNDACIRQYAVDFLSATAQQRLELLRQLDMEQFEYMNERSADQPAHYFRMMKELALLGYFTSEIGYTEALRYRETPGRFDPCVPYTRGEKAWAPHA